MRLFVSRVYDQVIEPTSFDTEFWTNTRHERLTPELNIPY